MWRYLCAIFLVRADETKAPGVVAGGRSSMRVRGWRRREKDGVKLVLQRSI